MRLLFWLNKISSIPPITVYDGDPLQYEIFITAFVKGVERKTTDKSNRLHYLEQYTRGYPKELVHSCRHLPPVEG